MTSTKSRTQKQSGWALDYEVFFQWATEKAAFFSDTFAPEPSVKVLLFLALTETRSACNYKMLIEILRQKGVLQGEIPPNTMRTSMLMLGKTIKKCQLPWVLIASRGVYKLEERTKRTDHDSDENLHRITNNIQRSKPCVPSEPVIFLDKPVLKVHEEIACTLVQKAMLPFKALFLLERSARWWESYSLAELTLRMPYELEAWQQLQIRDRLYAAPTSQQCLCVVGLATGEGLSEIELLKTIFKEGHVQQVHYLAIEISPRLLRDHMELLKEEFAKEIRADRLLCGGVLGDIFSEMGEAVLRVRDAFAAQGERDFLPSDAPLVVTYLGNCLGNHFPDREGEIFTLIRSVFQNRPLEILTGVSVAREKVDQYQNQQMWGEFLMNMPQFLLNTQNILVSTRDKESSELPEFTVYSENVRARYPAPVPEPYFVSHGIKGQIYRFYYKLGFDLHLVESLAKTIQPLPRDTLILLVNIIKYDMQTLVGGIDKALSFRVAYDDRFHKIVQTSNGIREYAVFSAYLESLNI